MALPANPVDGQAGVDGGKSYKWNAALGAWQLVGNGVSATPGFTNSDTPPGSVQDGWTWWAPTAGIYSVRIDGAWVEVGGNGIPVGGLTFYGAVRTAPVPIAFSATPVVDATRSNVFLLDTLTNNVTNLSVSGGTDGQTVNVRLVQDSTGNRTVAVAANIKVAGAIQAAASTATWLILTYVASVNRWEGAYSAVPA